MAPTFTLIGAIFYMQKCVIMNLLMSWPLDVNLNNLMLKMEEICPTKMLEPKEQFNSSRRELFICESIIYGTFPILPMKDLIFLF